MTTEVALRKQIAIVHRLRGEAAMLHEGVEAAHQVWLVENATLLGEELSAREAKDAAEAALREMTLAAYTLTGDKAPAPGVGIRIMTRLHYDPEKALVWAMEHRLALTLDKREFESLAKAKPPDFVTVQEEPLATIAADLTQAGGEVNRP